MAYFPNGTAGMAFDNQCMACLHEDPDIGCPIALIQGTYNYDQIGNEKLREVLSLLVDDKELCQMYPLIKDKL